MRQNSLLFQSKLQIFIRFAAFCFLFLLSLPPAVVFAQDFSGLIYRMDGTVQVYHANLPNAAWKNAKLGMGLVEKDKIKTGAKSYAQILLDDGSFYHLKENCELEILELRHDRKTKAQNTSYQVWKGTLLSRVQKLHPDSRAQFKSPTALVAIRGTEFAMDVAEDETTNVALFEGHVVVTDFVEGSRLPSDQNELLLELLHEVSLKANQMTTVTKSGISRPKKLGGKMKAWEQELQGLRAENEKAQAEQTKLSYEEAQSRRRQAREEAFK